MCSTNLLDPRPCAGRLSRDGPLRTLGGYIAYQLGVSSPRPHPGQRHASARRQPGRLVRRGVARLRPGSGQDARGAPGGDTAGPVAGATCRELGLSGRLLAVLGADDLACAAIGAAVRPGQTLYHLGCSPIWRRYTRPRPLPSAVSARPRDRRTCRWACSPARCAMRWGQRPELVPRRAEPAGAPRGLRAGRNPYDLLLGEMPAEPAGPMVMPRRRRPSGRCGRGPGPEYVTGRGARSARRPRAADPGRPAEPARGGHRRRKTRHRRWLALGPLAADRRRCHGLPSSAPVKSRARPWAPPYHRRRRVGCLPTSPGGRRAGAWSTATSRPRPPRPLIWLREARRGLQTPPAQEPAANP